MKRGTVYAALLSIHLLAGASWADTMQTFTPNPADLNDLDHYKAYRWGFDVSLPPGEEVISATLTLNNIRNWDNNANVLYIHLLDTANLGVAINTDNQGGGDYFVNVYTGIDEHLVTYENLTTTPQTLVYNFDAGDLAALNNYVVDGRIGLGFDPDCHFYNSGVSLQVVTPEPVTWVQLLAALPILRRRRANCG